MSNTYAPDAYELVDALADVGITATVQSPYAVVADSPFTPEEIAEALDIDSALCVYNLNGNIRIRAD